MKSANEVFAEFVGIESSKSKFACVRPATGCPFEENSNKQWHIEECPSNCEFIRPVYPDFFGNINDALKGYAALKEKGFDTEFTIMDGTAYVRIGPCSANAATFHEAIEKAVVEQVPWECACGWMGFPSEMNANPSGHKVCPLCGASGGLVYRDPKEQPWRIKPVLKGDKK